jgi:putative ABC transport system permease protein
MKTFRLLGLRRLRQQPLRAVIAAVAIGAGVAMALAILVVRTSIDHSVRDAARSVAGPAELRITGASERGGLSLAAVDAAAGVDGVQAVVPVVQAVTVVDREPGGASTPAVALGVDCRAQAVIGPLGCRPGQTDLPGDGPLAMSRSVVDAAGDAPSLRTDAGRVALAGVPVLDEGLAPAGNRLVVFPLDAARRRFARPLGVDIAYVLPRPGVDPTALRARLAAAVGTHNRVLGADEPPPVVGVTLEGVLPLFDLFAVFGLGIAIVLVRNTVTLSLEERRRQLAVIGALGARGRTVVGGAMGEAALLGAVGGALGTVGGVIIAGPIVASLSTIVEPLMGVPLQRHVSPAVAATGVLLGAAVGGLAALGPARRALRLEVAGELSGRARSQEAAPPRLRRALAVSAVVAALGLLACLVSGAGGGLHPWQAGLAPVGFLLACIGCLVVAANLAPLLVGVLAGATRGTRHGSVLLALANVVRQPRRTGILAVAITAPIVVGFITDGVVRSARATVDEAYAAGGTYAVFSTIGVSAGADGFVPPEVIDAVARRPEVAAVNRRASLLAGGDGGVVGVHGFDHLPPLDDQVLDGAIDPVRFRAGDAVIGAGLARRAGIRAGGTVTLDSPNGPVALPVLAVVSDGDFNGRVVEVDYHRLEALFGPVPPVYVQTWPAPGVGEDQLVAAVKEAGVAIEPSLRVGSGTQLAAEQGLVIDARMESFRVLQRGLVLVAFVAVLSNLLLVGLQRTREIGLLAAVGTTPAVLRRLVLLEVAVIGGVAAAQSAVVGPLLLRGMIAILPVIIGFENPTRPDWGSLVSGAVVAVGVALVAALLPAYRASRTAVLDALRYE